MRDPTLWSRIEGFALPAAPGASVPNLQTRMEAREGWTPDYASDALHEYRRFLYLVHVSGKVVTPSVVIDAVWHAHMQDSAAYTAFCHEIFGELLHHDPCEGDEEMPRYEAQYEATHELYAEEFGTAPPPHVWPPPQDEDASRSLRARWRFANLAGLLAGLAVFSIWAFLTASGVLGFGGDTGKTLVIGAAVSVFAGYLALSRLQPPDTPGPRYKNRSSPNGGCGGSSGCGSGCGGGGCG